MTKQLLSNSPVVPYGEQREGTSTMEMTMAGIAIVASTYGLARYCFGLFLPEMRAAFSLTVDEVGWIASASYVGYLTATFVGSWLSTLAGPRLPVILGGLMAASGMMIIGRATDPLMLSLGVFVAGTSPGLAYPPFSDVVVRNVSTARRETTYAWINSGTGFGVLVAGALALVAGRDWRLAWLAFSGIALAATIWNWRTVPKPQIITDPQSLGFLAIARGLLLPQAIPLFASSLLFGAISSVYWTFAVDLLRSLDSRPHDAVLFWMVLGSAGIFGSFAGQLSRKLGLLWAYRSLMIIVGLSVAALPFVATSRTGIILSGGFFGVGFIVATALFGMWSMRIFTQTPSIGFGATFFLISLGQGIGPVFAGYIILLTDKASLFLGAGLLCSALAAFAQKQGMPPIVEQ